MNRLRSILLLSLTWSSLAGSATSFSTRDLNIGLAQNIAAAKISKQTQAATFGERIASSTTTGGSASDTSSTLAAQVIAQLSANPALAAALVQAIASANGSVSAGSTATSVYDPKTNTLTVNDSDGKPVNIPVHMTDKDVYVTNAAITNTNQFVITSSDGSTFVADLSKLARDDNTTISSLSIDANNKLIVTDSNGETDVVQLTDAHVTDFKRDGNTLILTNSNGDPMTVTLPENTPVQVESLTVATHTDSTSDLVITLTDDSAIIYPLAQLGLTLDETTKMLTVTDAFGQSTSVDISALIATPTSEPVLVSALAPAQITKLLNNSGNYRTAGGAIAYAFYSYQASSDAFYASYYASSHFTASASASAAYATAVASQAASQAASYASTQAAYAVTSADNPSASASSASSSAGYAATLSEYDPYKASATGLARAARAWADYWQASGGAYTNIPSDIMLNYLRHSADICRISIPAGSVPGGTEAEAYRALVAAKTCLQTLVLDLILLRMQELPRKSASMAAFSSPYEPDLSPTAAIAEFVDLAVEFALVYANLTDRVKGTDEQLALARSTGDTSDDVLAAYYKAKIDAGNSAGVWTVTATDKPIKANDIEVQQNTTFTIPAMPPSPYAGTPIQIGNDTNLANNFSGTISNHVIENGSGAHTFIITDTNIEYDTNGTTPKQVNSKNVAKPDLLFTVSVNGVAASRSLNEQGQTIYTVTVPAQTTAAIEINTTAGSTTLSVTNNATAFTQAGTTDVDRLQYAIDWLMTAKNAQQQWTYTLGSTPKTLNLDPTLYIGLLSAQLKAIQQSMQQ